MTFDTQPLIDAIKAHTDSILMGWLGEAKQRVNGRTSYICPLCQHGQNGDGLCHNIKSNDPDTALKCHVCKFSGDVIALYQKATGKGFPESLDDLATMAGIAIDPLRSTSGASSRNAPRKSAASGASTAVARDKPTEPEPYNERNFWRGGTREMPRLKNPELLIGKHIYLGTPTEPIFMKLRIANPAKDKPHKPGKDVLPFEWCEERKQWYCGRRSGAFPRMLYKPDNVNAAKGKTLFLVEGEKCAEALSGPLGQLATCGDDGHVWHEEYTGILKAAAPKGIVILPDNDSDGETYGQAAAMSLYRAGIPVKVLHLVDEWPELDPAKGIVDPGGDIANVCDFHGVGNNDLTDEQRCEARIEVCKRINALGERTPLWTPPPEPAALSTTSAGADKPEFIPFDSEELAEPPDFPIDAMPEPLRRMALETARSFQVDVAMAAVVLLGIVSACLLKKFSVLLNRDWFEPLGLYFFICARPSERKSPVLARLMEPVDDYVRSENKRRLPQMEREALDTEILTNRITAEKKMLAKGKGDAQKVLDLTHELDDLKQGATRPFRLLLDDTTPEALADIMSQSGGRCAILSDEPGIIGMLAGRYSSEPNLDAFLKSYDCRRPLTIDRIGRGHSEVVHPLMTLLLMGQPVVLDTFLKNPTFSGRGLTSRFCICRPKSMAADLDVNAPTITDETSSAYVDLITLLLEIPEPDEESDEHPHVIKLDRSAHAAFDDLRTRIAHQCGSMEDDAAALEAWLAKHPGRVARIAGILHVANHPGNDGAEAEEILIDEREMNAALAIGDYFEHSIKQILEEAATVSEGVLDGKYILKRLSSLAPGTVLTRTELLNSYCRLRKFRAGGVDSLEPGLRELESRGYIRRDGQTVTIIRLG